DQRLQRSATLPGIAVFHREIVDAELLDQGGGFSAESRRFRHQLLPGSLALFLEDAIVLGLVVFGIWWCTAIAGRLEAPHGVSAPEVVVGDVVLRAPGTRLAARRALLLAQARGEGILVRLPACHQIEHPSVGLARDWIHRLSLRTCCRSFGH